MDLFEQPSFGVQQMADRTDVGYTTANRVVDRLVEDGLVEEITDREYDRVYRAVDIVRFLDEPLSRLPATDDVEPFSAP
jgi:DNA-binding MarR family transcriptional regulator